MSLKSSEKVETNVYAVEIGISAEQLHDGTVKAYNKQKGKISIPGFRKGKVPKQIIEKMYGKEFFYEDAIDILYPDVVSEAIEEAKLEIVDAPYEVEVKKVDETGAEISLKVVVKPEEVEVGEYKGLKAEKPETEVTDAEVDAQLDTLLDRNARMISIDDRPVEDGDLATIDFEGFVDGVAFEGGKGENYELGIGSGQFIPGFEEQIIGKNIGEEFDVLVTFPDEYAEELAGKEATFKVTVKELKKKELPELDDEFAKDVSEFDTLDDFKKDIKEKAAAEKEAKAKEQFESSLLKQVADGLKAEIPQVMIDKKSEELKQNMEQQMAQQGLSLDIYLQYMGIENEKFMEDMKNQAEAQVRTRLALEKIAEIEKIEATQEDIDAEYQKYADMYKMELESIKKFIPEDGLKKDLSINKTVDMILENAVEEKPKKTAAKKTESAEKKPAAKKAPAKKKAAESKDAE